MSTQYFVKFHFVNSLFCQILFCQLCFLSTLTFVNSVFVNSDFCQLCFCQLWLLSTLFLSTLCFVNSVFVNSVFCQLLFCQLCVLSTLFCQLLFCQTMRSLVGHYQWKWQMRRQKSKQIRAQPALPGPRWRGGWRQMSVVATCSCFHLLTHSVCKTRWLVGILFLLHLACFTLIVIKTHLETAKSGTGGWNWIQNKIRRIPFSTLFN